MMGDVLSMHRLLWNRLIKEDRLTLNLFLRLMTERELRYVLSADDGNSDGQHIIDKVRAELQRRGLE